MKAIEYFDTTYSQKHIKDIMKEGDLSSLYDLIDEYAEYYHQEQIKVKITLPELFAMGIFGIPINNFLYRKYTGGDINEDNSSKT